MHPRTTRTLRWSHHPATLAALLHSSLFSLTLSFAPSSTHTRFGAALSFLLHNKPFFREILCHGYHCTYHKDIIQHGIAKLSRSPMITCDQVVSGGSAERTTKMAAAPAADSACSPPGSSTLFSRFLLSSRAFLLLFRLPPSPATDCSLFLCLFLLRSFSIRLRIFPTLNAFRALFRAREDSDVQGERV